MFKPVIIKFIILFFVLYPLLTIEFTLNSCSQLPVLYVFGKQPIDLAHCLESFDQFFKQDKNQPLLIMYDVVYSYCIGKNFF